MAAEQGEGPQEGDAKERKVEVEKLLLEYQEATKLLKGVTQLQEAVKEIRCQDNLEGAVKKSLECQLLECQEAVIN